MLGGRSISSFKNKCAPYVKSWHLKKKKRKEKSQNATAKNKLCNHLDRTPRQTEKGWPPLSDPVITGTMADGNNGVRAQPAPDNSYIRATTGTAHAKTSSSREGAP